MSKTFPRTMDSNVFTKDGVRLDAMLEIILAELNKREVNTFYHELTDLGLTKNTNTYDILNAMNDFTISVLSVENDDPLTKEIGSRTGGIMILFKQTSVYFSGGVYISYRYGDIFYGHPTTGGEGFEWVKNSKTIHSLHNGASSTLSAINEYIKIGGWGGQSVNPVLDIYDEYFKIPDNVTQIMVSGCVVVESKAAGTKFLQIYKNGASSGIMVKQTTTQDTEECTLVIPPIILPCKKDDTFDLRIYSNSLDTLRMKHLTIEVLQ